jgi:hypothetical protein
MTKTSSLGVQLPEGHTGSTFLHALLRHGVDRFPDVFRDVRLTEDPKRFRTSFDEILPRFEAARIASPQRTEIARSMRCEAGEGLRFTTEAGTRPFVEEMRRQAEPLQLIAHQTRGPGHLRPVVTCRGTRREGAALRAWVDTLHHDHLLTEPARQALVRILDQAAGDGLSLAGHRFALLGAGAELAPTELLLAAGADVLWIDLRDPPAELLQRTDLGGTLHVPAGGANLLAAPAEILATVRAFAEAGPVHLGMYAYAGGDSQEWRLTASMNAILRSLPPGAVRSLALLISPTTANAVTAGDREVARHRLDNPSPFRRLLRRAGALRPGHVDSAGGSVARSIVALQGASYQAAQYVGKVLAAEAHASHGPRLDDGLHPLTMSANVAPITATRSLSHPVFTAGFLGAPSWDIFISEPAATRHVNGLLAIHDLTHPDASASADRAYPSTADRARAVFEAQFHGGVFTQPYAVIDGIRLAAVQGLMQKPQLLAGLIRGA